MSRRVNILGNGPGAALFPKKAPGETLVCNMPPVNLKPEQVFASCMVDFKMMNALQDGKCNLDKYDWILGTRPRLWVERNTTFYLKYSQNIKGFHTYVPAYAQLPGHTVEEAATNYSCGHMATDYACRKMKATEVHMYGFDAMFDLDLSSYSDNFLTSDRGLSNKHRMAGNWRPIWSKFFREFEKVEFYLYHTHTDIKLATGPNVTCKVLKADGEEG